MRSTSVIAPRIPTAMDACSPAYVSSEIIRAGNHEETRSRNEGKARRKFPGTTDCTTATTCAKALAAPPATSGACPPM